MICHLEQFSKERKVGVGLTELSHLEHPHRLLRLTA